MGFDEITNGIKYVRPGGGFEPRLTLFKKTEVNGKNEDPLYTFLKKVCPLTDTAFQPNLFYSPLNIGDVRWNFEKFLISRDGKPFARYHFTNLITLQIKNDIDYLLKQNPSGPNETVINDTKEYSVSAINPTNRDELYKVILNRDNYN